MCGYKKSSGELFCASYTVSPIEIAYKNIVQGQK